MSTYQPADQATLDTVADVMEKYHGELHDAGVNVYVLMAYPPQDENGEDTAPAIMVNGYPAAGVIRLLNLKERSKFGYDAEMTLDALRWSESSQLEQEAIADHELTHLELVTDMEGNVKRDDAERPRLKMRRHDRHFGWFDIVAQRHKRNSMEVQQALEMVKDYMFRQKYLPGMEDLPKIEVTETPKE